MNLLKKYLIKKIINKEEIKMYKDLKTMIIIGSSGTGKTRLISKYNEEIINEDKRYLYY